MADKVKDPVCGMDVDKESGKPEPYGPSQYFFCSDECRTKFKKSPQNYIPQTG
jgi:P-type Cu+ transporter